MFHFLMQLISLSMQLIPMSSSLISQRSCQLNKVQVFTMCAHSMIYYFQQETTRSKKPSIRHCCTTYDQHPLYSTLEHGAHFRLFQVTNLVLVQCGFIPPAIEACMSSLGYYKLFCCLYIYQIAVNCQE